MLDTNDKKSHVAALIKLAKADGVVTQHEVDLIKIIAIRLGISSNDFNEIVINAESIPASSPSTREEKELYLYNLFLLMKIDLKTDAEEQKICEELGARLGLGVEEIKRAGEYMTANFDEVVSFADFSNALNQ